MVQKILKISQTCAHAEKKFENLWADSLMVYRKINLKETTNRISCRLEHQLDAVHTCIYSSLPPVSFNEKKWTVKAFRCFFSALSRRRRSCDWFDPRTVVLLPPSSLLPPRPSLDLRLTTTESERARERTHRIRGIFIIKFTFNCSLLEKEQKQPKTFHGQQLQSWRIYATEKQHSVLFERFDKLV